MHILIPVVLMLVLELVLELEMAKHHPRRGTDSKSAEVSCTVVSRRLV